MFVLYLHAYYVHSLNTHTHMHRERVRVTHEFTLFFVTSRTPHTPLSIFEHFISWTGTPWFTFLIIAATKNILASRFARSTFGIIDLSWDWANCYEEAMKFMSDSIISIHTHTHD